MAQVTLRNVTKNYDETPAVRGIDLDIADKEFVVLVGPSGCGKSTTLRMIAGLEDITDGEVLIGGEVVNDVPPKDRDIAMVFQNYALYPHMTVFENMSFGLRLKKVAKDEIKARVENAARILDISELLERKPKQLSGGQRQRVAMGRAIVRDPKVFLFDEPLSNLDAKLRVQMRTEIKRVHQKVRTTTIYVTHDQVEAMTLADRVVVMNAGLIEQVGAPNDLYHAPATTFRRRLHRLAGHELRALRTGGVGRRAARPAGRRHRIPGAGEPHRALPAASRPRWSAVRLEAGAHHGAAPDLGAESASLRGPARRHRADGNGYTGALPGERNGGVRPGQPERRTAGRQPHEAWSPISTTCT